MIPTESVRYFEGFELVNFAKSALFKSYSVIYLFDRRGHIGIYEVLFVFYSYPNAMRRKRRPLTALQFVEIILATLRDGPQL